jgi:signal transduction histidine kinase
VGWLSTRRVPVLFAVATLLPIAALCWLGLRTLENDRDLERQRRIERLEVAAGRVALEIEQNLQRIEAKLADGDGIRFLPQQVVAPPDEPLLFRPEAPPASVWSSPQLNDAAQQEHRAPEQAIAAYQRVVAGGRDPDRGEALVALGALLRRQRRFDEALRAYAHLASLGPQPVAGGQPAALVAIQGRAKTFLERGDQAQLRTEALAFSRALNAGGWLIDRVSFELYQQDMIEPWGGPPADVQAVRRADHVTDLWRQWRRGELPARGRRFVGHGEGSSLALWVAGTDAVVATMLSSDQLRERWQPLWQQRGLTAAIVQTDGAPVFGSVSDGVELSPTDTRLPFVLAVADVGVHGSGDAVRRRVVLAGVLLACALMIAASYGLYRITTRELSLARQQTDFVAAVSHEFRTPLTSMRHLLDLLLTRGITSERRQTEYYALLAGETDRLQRMVETLLSFGRIDAAAHVWKLEPLGVTELVDSVADAFARELGTRSLERDVAGALPAIGGDREALERAIWNLLENAVKYSPGDSPIRLFARREGATVMIGVQDRGIGISLAEQPRVFQKFVRGDAAKRAGIRGVGVGLALVKQIAEAHGGRVDLTSTVGVGSTFTLVLPVAG